MNLFINYYSKFKALLFISGKKGFLKVLFFLILASILELGGIGLIYPYFDAILDISVIQENQYLNFFFDTLGFSNESDFLFFLGILLVLFIIFSGVFGAISRIIIDKYVWHSNKILTTLSYKMNINRSYLELRKLNSNNLTNDIISEVSVFVNGLMVPIFDLIPRVMMLILISSLILIVNVKVTLIVFFSIGLIYITVFRVFRKKLSTMSSKRFTMQRALLDYVNTSIKGIKDIKVNKYEKFYIDMVNVPAKEYSSLNSAISIFSQMPKYILEALVFSSTILILLFNFSDEGNIIKILPLLSFFAVAAIKLLPHINGIFTAIAKIKFNIKALDIIYDQLINQNIQNDNSIITHKFKSLELKNMFFNFEDGDALLEDINFKLKNDDFIILSGKSGSGKSTLVDIILGLINASSGQFILNNKTHSGMLSERIKIGYVAQEIMLFEGSLISNIALVDKNPDLKLIKNIIKIACLEDVLESFGGNLNSVIYENGKNLSVGQRQRISIARSLYNNPDLLILDEGSSALDSETEKRVIENLIDIKVAILLITHNKNLKKYATKSFEIQKGKLHEF